MAPRAPIAAAFLASILFGAGAAGASGEDAPRIVSVAPALRGEELVCDLETAGLPTEKAATSMQGGLPSGVEIVAELLDDGGNVLAQSRVFIRVAFDLWEEIYRIEREGDGEAEGPEKRFETIASLRAFLASIEGLPVAPIAALAGGGRFRVRVDLVSHTIAPAERTRIGEWIAGETAAGPGGSGTARDADEREVSLGLGSLIRFFYGGSSGARPAVSADSEWFRWEDLRRAADSH
jgi:hypothetical protein